MTTRIIERKLKKTWRKMQDCQHLWNGKTTGNKLTRVQSATCSVCGMSQQYYDHMTMKYGRKRG